MRGTKWSIRTISTCVVILLAFCCAACGSKKTATEESTQEDSGSPIGIPLVTSSAPTPSATGTPTIDFSGVPEIPLDDEVVVDDEGPAQKQNPPLVWDNTAKISAVKRAEQAMTVFTKQDLPQNKWFAELKPFLDFQAQQDYESVDPTGGAKVTVEKPARIIEQTSPGLVSVQVPTDAGAYLLIMSRTQEDPLWKVSRIVFPENLGD